MSVHAAVRQTAGVRRWSAGCLVAVLVAMVVVGLGWSRSVRADAPIEVPSATSESIAIVVVDSASIDDEVRRELALRSGGRRIEPSADLVDVPTQRFAWAGTSASGGARLLEVVLSDGRAYSRLVDAPPDQLARATAGALANMLDAIEDGTLAPERTGIAVPIAIAEPAPEPVVSATTPAPVVVPPRVDVPRTVVPSWWIGPRIGGGAIFGVGPPTPERGFVAVGGSIGVDAMHHRGVKVVGGIVGGDVRIATVSKDALRVVRVRVAVSGGVAVRKAWFVMPLRAGVAVEPVISRGDSVRDAAGRSVSPRPLVGAVVQASPSWVWWSRSRRTGLRVAVDVELAGSMEMRARPGVVRWVHAGDDARGLARAGGVEMGVGVSVGGWFAVR